jgi:hypothetical protein
MNAFPPRRRISFLVTVTAAVTLLAGCGGADPVSKAGPSPSPESVAPAGPVVPETPTAAATPLPKPGKTDAAGLVVPARTAGDLAEDSFPRPADLGRGWQQFIDPGDVAEGYTGNGAWVRERGASEVVQAVVPLGCAGLTSPPVLPVPKHALEATYRGPGDAPGVAIVLDYATAAQASRFVAGMAKIARSCQAPPRKVRADDPLTVVVEPVRIGARTVLDRRREYGVGASEWLWSEMVVLHGARVGLLILASPTSSEAPDLNRLSERLRTSVSR